ncbi:MAG: hypothetical protein RJA76_1477 [Bacteroidota bacterium]|jgi:uncharacterized membrane protein
MEFGKYFAVMFGTALKYIAGPITGFSLGLTWYETLMASWVGFMLTVLIVVSIGKFVVNWIASFRKSKPIVFSKRARYAVGIWQKFGIKGIAALTPLIFTPIGGSLLSLSFKVPLPRILFFMAISGIIWSSLYTLIIYQLTFLKAYLF